MGKGGRGPGAAGEAARRRRAEARREEARERGALEGDLAACGRDMGRLDAERAALVRDRDALVGRALAEGWPMARIAGALGVSRQALMKRAGRGGVAASR
ncbi:MAG: hypothetical protein LBD90_08625 [Bifidobacteriaceae bacterium]|jgi:hypothetical protein|nr:hypothetical protein [Bifidobacteriaceae bacterium]